MPNPPQAAFLEALGWTILNSWWQFGLLWALLLFLKMVLPKGSAALRYNVSLAMLVTGMTWTIISLLLRWYRLLDGGFHFVGITGNNLHSWYTLADTYLSQATPYISILYLACLSVQLFRFSRLFHLSRQLKTGGLLKAPVEWRLFLADMSSCMNIRNAVQLWVSEKIDTPLILGWLKPVILLPVTAVNQLSSAQLEAILIHELAHIRRNDYFWNLIVAFSEVLFYYNPFARWLIREIRIERENSCDDWVLQFPYKPEQYAHALLKLEHQRIGQQSQLLLAARGSSRNLLLYRVKRMLNLPVANPDGQGFLKLMTILAIFLGLAVFLEPRQEIEQLFERALPSIPASRESNAKTVQGFPIGKNKTLALQAAPKPRKTKSAIQQNDPNATGGNDLSQDNMLNLILVGNDPSEPADAAVPAFIQEERAYSLVEDKPLEITTPVTINRLPYVPKSSFQVFRQQDSIIPQAVLAEKLSVLQEKEAVLQAKLAQVQQYWDKIQQEKLANIDLSEQYNLKKNELEGMQIQVEKQAKQFEQLIEKQAKMLQEQLQKTPRKRKVVHI